MKLIINELLKNKTIVRIEQNIALSTISIAGNVLDVASGSNPSYKRFLKLDNTNIWHSSNFSNHSNPSIVFDAEKEWPNPPILYDTILIINCLYIFEDPAFVLKQAKKYLSDHGQIVLTAPLLFPATPEPNDYHRWTTEGAILFAKKLDFRVMSIKKYGGIFTFIVDLLRPFLQKIFLYLPCAIIAYYLNVVSHKIKAINEKNSSLGTILVLEKLS